MPRKSIKKISYENLERLHAIIAKLTSQIEDSYLIIDTQIANAKTKQDLVKPYKDIAYNLERSSELCLRVAKSFRNTSEKLANPDSAEGDE